MRESWDRYFLDIAVQVATRATCDRLHVGCVIVDRTKSILATGYNGSVRGLPHCDDAGHDMDEGNHCVRTVHAEANAIAQAARHGTSVHGARAYVTACPCWPCTKLLLNAGITSIVYLKAYRNDARVVAACEAAGCVLRLAEDASAASPSP